ncbi:MAG: SDR family oxidoreductase [Polyangiaceae bacterium]
MKLESCRAIITGGAKGMGLHFALRLHELGARVAVGDVDEAGLEALPSGIHKRRLDVSQESDCEGFVAWAQERMDGLNVLVNNAGIIRDGLLVKRARDTGELSKLSKADWDAVTAVNLSGATFMAREFAFRVAESEERPSLIVNMSSVSRHGNRGQSSYVAAKAALAANAVTWARELAKFGTRVVGIAPGMVETPMTQGMNQKARDALVAAIPVGRIGVPEDLWLALRFCIECDYFNARVLDVDGGLVMT